MKKQILIPTDDSEFPFVDDRDDPRIWDKDIIYEEDYEYYGKVCTSCGKPHGEAEVYTNSVEGDDAQEVLCSDCVVVVTQSAMLEAWKGKEELAEMRENYIGAMVFIWESTKFHCKKYGWNATVSDGQAAFRILKEWGVLDENGDRIL